MTDNFADTYFSRDDCAKIGYIREDIDVLYKKGDINTRESYSDYLPALCNG